MTLQEARAAVEVARKDYKQAEAAYFGFGGRHGGLLDPARFSELMEAFYQAQTRLSRAQILLENHPEMHFDLFEEMFGHLREAPYSPADTEV